MRRFISAIILSLALVSSSSAYYYPTQVEQPAGRWHLYHRPTFIGDALFGPLWVFIPNQPQSPVKPAGTIFQQPLQGIPSQNPAIIDPAPGR